jgi:hypothetical protein
MAVASQFIASTDFRHSFDKKPFLFHHNLSEHALLTFPALHALAKKAADPANRPQRKGMLRQSMTPGFLVLKGRGSVRWGGDEFHRVLDEAFENFEQSNIRLKLTAVHEYDGYRELLEECTRQLSEVTGVDFAREYGHGIATFFIASPNETTPYHIDEEVNFLLQIHGPKRVFIFDGNDRKIVSDRDLEQFWFGRIFLDQVPGTSPQLFEIGPGDGIFNPPFFPHYVETVEQPCISLSLGYPRLRFPEAEVHRLNAYMRKYGWNPSPVGSKPGVDQLKSQFVRRALNLKRMVRGA